MTTTETRSHHRWPVLQGVLPVRASQVPGEIAAGITLAALAIPEVMGYTAISGTPVVTGLYTLLVPTILFALFGSSRHLVVGADSATAAILAAGLAGMAAAGSDQYLALACVLALMAAGFLFIARIADLGFMAAFLSHTVLTGFLTGVGIQVSLNGLSGMLGLEDGGHGSTGTVRHAIARIAHADPATLVMALATIAVIIGARRVSHRIPGALIAVAGTIALSRMLDLDRYLEVLGPVPGGLPGFALPEIDWSLALVSRLVPVAFAMSVVILAQSAATSRAYANRYNEPFSANTDLLALGLANVGAGLSGTFVVNGSPTKTQMVDSAGGRTQLSLLVTACITLLVLLFFTDLLASMPKAVLSAVVFLIGIELIDIKGMTKIFRERRAEFRVASMTVLMVVFIGVEQGIILAVLMSLVSHTRHGYRPGNVLLRPGAGGIWQARPVASAAQAVPGLVIYRFTHSMYYANTGTLSQEVTALAGSADPPLRWLCIEASAVDDVDFSAAETLRSLRDMLRERGIRLVVTQSVQDISAGSRSQFIAIVGRDHFFDTLADVMEAFRRDREPAQPDGEAAGA